MTAKFDKFIGALEALCREHEVIICPNMYDSLQVWDAKKGESPIQSNGIEDKTASDKDGS